MPKKRTLSEVLGSSQVSMTYGDNTQTFVKLLFRNILGLIMRGGAGRHRNTVLNHGRRIILPVVPDPEIVDGLNFFFINLVFC